MRYQPGRLDYELMHFRGRPYKVRRVRGDKRLWEPEGNCV